jgi:cell division protein FtsW (lipid II flippase)
LLVTALVIGLCGSCLVAVAFGGSFEASGALSLPHVATLWLEIAIAAFGCHFLLVRRGSDADEMLLPLSLALTGVGMTIIFSLKPEQAQRQVLWLWISLAVLLGLITGLRQVADLRAYSYLWGLATVVLLVLPMFLAPVVNGARLWIQIAGFRFQPSEVAKITLVLFMASYLASAQGEDLTAPTRVVLGLPLPAPRYLVPLLAMWAVATLLHLVLRDLGTGMLFFGTFIAMLYAASGNGGYVAFGLVGFLGSSWLAQFLFAHVRNRIAAWLDPWSEAMISHGGYQIAEAIFAIAAGGATGVGLGMSQMTSPLSGKTVFAATTDLPFAALCEQLGLWGAGLLCALYAFWVYRALRIAVHQTERFEAYLAVGLGSMMAIQMLVIMGGVTKLIPLTGITLPFVSYGGSSLVSNFVVLGLMLRCSEGRQ